jgi:hypothetical protein
MDAAGLWIEKGGQKAERKKRGTLKSLWGILVPVRRGLMFCFLHLLSFGQNRLEVWVFDAM